MKIMINNNEIMKNNEINKIMKIMKYNKWKYEIMK